MDSGDASKGYPDTVTNSIFYSYLTSIISALTNRPVIDRHERRMFVSSAGTSFNCLDAVSGRILWSNPTVNATSVYLTEAKISPSNERVYSIQVSKFMTNFLK